MADPADKWPDNVGGHAVIEGQRVSYYVDRECILCTVCSELAPENFRMAVSEDHDVCYRQPTTPEALEACEDARASCPVEAIGRDG